MTSNIDIYGILRALGMGRDRRYILSSLCLVIISFFYLFVVGSLLHSKIYTFQHRVTYEAIFVNHMINLDTDILILLSASIAWYCLSIKTSYKKIAIIIFFSFFLILIIQNFGAVAHAGAILSLPFIICLIIIDKIQNQRILYHDWKISLYYFTILGIVLASSGIISIILHVTTGVSTVTIEKYPYAVYQELFSLISPILMTVLVFCIPLKVILSEIFRKLKINRNNFLLGITKDKLSTKQVLMYLFLCVMLGISVTLISHAPITNPNHQQIGVDSTRYAKSLNLMKDQSVNPMDLALKISGDRPLTMIILFLITEATNADPFQVIEYSPMLFAPLLVLVTFFLTRELTANEKISIIASFLTAISFQTLIGIYSGFYANWLALVLGYLAFGLLVKCLKRPSNFGIVALALSMTGLLLAHTYTWSIMISVAFVFLFALHTLNYYPRKHFLLLYLVLSSSIAVDVLKSSWTGLSTGLEADVSIGFRHGLGISQFSERLRTLAETVQTYYGGVYANITILGLVMYWLFRSEPRELANVFIMISLSTALIPVFIGDYLLQSRVLYDIPFQIPAAISLYTISKKNGKMIFIALLLITGYLSFHVLANLGYVPPPS